MTEGWMWRYEGYDAAQERLRESLCTLGNGYVATRGAAAEARAGPVHYPGTYAAGCYDRLASKGRGPDEGSEGARGPDADGPEREGAAVGREELVNLPNWLPVRVRARGGTWVSPDDCAVLGYRQDVHLRHGTMTRRMRLRDDDGRTIVVEEARLVHMGDPHLAAQRIRVEADGWAGLVEVESALDGDVANQGAERHQDSDGRHLAGLRTGAAPPATVWLSCRTASSGVEVALAARTRVEEGTEVTSWDAAGPDGATHTVVLPIAPGRPVVVEKTVAVHTSRDPGIGDPLRAALDRLARAPGYAALLDGHVSAWERIWRRAELEVPGRAGHLLRLHLFHVLQTLSPHTAGLDTGVPARGLHGEAYQGHVLWDELFVLPFLNLHLPEVSRALLLYRHRRLGAACRAASEAGEQGAMYPWRSGGDGREETRSASLDPRSGRRVPDRLHLQRHVGSAVAYNVWQYCLASGDTDFLHRQGAEMLLQIARFWAHTAVWDPPTGSYRIRGVVGPDEFHDGYPGVREAGLDDNTYTNVTAAWVLSRALELSAMLPAPHRDELLGRLGIDGTETALWEDVAHRLRVPFHDGVISQFDGYGRLAELDWDAYRGRYGDIRRLDRILAAEGDSVNRYQVSKQADVLMLGYLFPPAELAALFAQLGHRLDEGTWTATVDHYLRRTSHGSALSGLVHGWVLARSRRAEAWSYVHEALIGDVADVQGGTTGEGIHLGAMAGTLDLVQRGLTGLEPRADALRLDPAPLPELSRYHLSLRYRGHRGIGLTVKQGRLHLRLPDSGEDPLAVVVGDAGPARRTASVAPGHEITVDLADGSGSERADGAGSGRRPGPAGPARAGHPREAARPAGPAQASGGDGVTSRGQ
ncbi:glycosyl hydrolase family 65 protein [Streptomyces sp. V4-01]|uniref:Glycosyl hydrolase family 65 protein n=1 Tax=Actinacidiphila polyblastidii TaxID=3110430 RepID=A0ABU7PD86_9ACTN|nr:glycosyl hydrolase family 65 protein [Streptomyces sp. V4-01]